MALSFRPSSVRIGLLVQRLDSTDAYNRKFWTTAYDLAKDNQTSLLLVAGQSPDGPDTNDRTHTAVYGLLNDSLIDGAILSQTVTARMSPERLAQFDAQFPSLPLVSTTIPLGHRPCFRVANEPGLRALIRHLIGVHGCRRIVHVRGPYPNHEAAVREAVWREELSRAEIEPDPSWLVQGHYDIERLDGIGRRVLDQTGGDFDALVACNDQAALRIIEDFKTLGYAVPGDYLVCGFDDIQLGQISRPSLTTVRQPTEDQTHAAWDTLLELLQGHQLPSNSKLETSLVVRASCSCPPKRQTPGAFSVLDDFPQDRLDLLALQDSQMQTLERMVYELHNFVRALNRVAEVEALGDVLHQWLPRLGVSTFAIFVASTATGEAREHLCEWDPERILPTAPEFFRLLAARPDREIEAGQVFSGAGFSPQAWLDALGPSILGLFPLALGNVWFGLAFFELPRTAGLLERALQEQLASVFDRLSREKSFRETSTEARVREQVHRENMATLSRLVAEVAHEVNSPLAAIVSSNSSVAQRLTELEDEWVEQAVGPATPARTLIESLVRHWRESSGAEFPTNERTRRTLLASWLQNLGVQKPEEGADILISVGFEGGEEELRCLVSRGNFSGSLGHLGRLGDLRVSSKIIDLAAEKIGNFVAMLRSNTKIRGKDELVAIDVKDSLETTMLLLKGELQQGLEVSWEESVVPRILCRPEEIQRVWTNLLRNAFHAMGHRGQLVLRWRSEGDRVRVDVVDTGHGIAPEDQDRIFTPFFSTKPEGEGLGLGLDITKTLVEGMGGQIRFESVRGLTTFSVWLTCEKVTSASDRR